MAHGDRARIQPADHARSLFRVELIFSRSSTRGIGQKMHLRSYATFTTFQFFHLLSIFICLFFPPSPLRNFHVTAILRVIEGRKKIRGEIDRILGKELERKLEGQGCFTFPLFHGVTQFQACVVLISRCPIVSEWSCGKGIEQVVLHRLPMRLIKFQIASIPRRLCSGGKNRVMEFDTKFTVR